jgi:hypothetical protein
MTKTQPKIAETARRLANNLEMLMKLEWADGCQAALMNQVVRDVDRLVDASAGTTEPVTGLICKAATDLPTCISNIKADFNEPDGLNGVVEDHSDYGSELRVFVRLVRKHYPETK